MEINIVKISGVHITNEVLYFFQFSFYNCIVQLGSNVNRICLLGLLYDFVQNMLGKLLVIVDDYIILHSAK